MLMDTINLFVLARIVHIIGIVFWIGGVAFITTVLIPSIKKLPDSHERLNLFEKLEGPFAKQAKLMTLLTVFSGAYMLEAMQAWHHFLSLEFWWLHLMSFIWLIFTVVLFVFEPLFLHEWFKKKALQDSDKTFSRLHLMHKLLLALSLLAVFGAMAGSHGWML